VGPVTVDAAPVAPVGPVGPVGPVLPAPAIAVSRSVIVLAVIVRATCHPDAMSLAVVPSCALVIVKVEPTMFVTRTISALSSVGAQQNGQIVTLNGTAGKSAASAA